MSCRSCDLKRIYKLFEEKKRREAEEAKDSAEKAALERERAEEKSRKEAEESSKRAHKKKTYEPVEIVVEMAEEPINEEVKEEPSNEFETIQTEGSIEMI